MTKLVAFVIVIAPLFDAYSVVGETLMSIVILFITALVAYYYSKFEIKLPKYYLWFFIYGISIPILNSISGTIDPAILSSYISILSYTFIIGAFIPFIETQTLIKYYTWIVVFVSVIFVAQEIMYAVSGERFSALVSFLKLRYARGDMESFMQRQAMLDRSSSVFLEPAHFAQYIAPFLAIQMFRAIKKKRFLYLPVILTSLILFMSKSGNAVLFLGIAWIAYIMSFPMNHILKYGIFIPTVIIICFWGFDFISDTQVGQSLLARKDEIQLGGTKWVSSGTMRIYRGYLVYGGESAMNQLLGVGTGGIESVINQSDYLWMFYDFERYVNNIQTLLIGFGLIGTIVFSFHIYDLLKINNFAGRTILLIMIGAFCIESFLFNPKMIFYICLAVAFQKSKISDNWDTGICPGPDNSCRK